ncbi:predicted protein [Histoplasma capsulatum var. duboisii H88]|uniref:Predicted protein n=1 Tax=Ajellomyces capsulatus (strain H88) TaxID=544711 RepID=F0UBQ2_AJEC8|nr:predicted protein [Histoplasma capsulatum var. duboisii H88]
MTLTCASGRRLCPFRWLSVSGSRRDGQWGRRILFGVPRARNSGSMAATVIRCVDVDEPVRGTELSSRRLAPTTGFFQPSTCHYYGVSGDRERTSMAKQWPGEGGVRVRCPRGLVTFRWRLQEARFRKQSRRKRREYISQQNIPPYGK